MGKDKIIIDHINAGNCDNKLTLPTIYFSMLKVTICPAAGQYFEKIKCLTIQFL